MWCCWCIQIILKGFGTLFFALLKDHNYPHVCLYVGYFCSTNSTFVVFDTSMLFPIMLEQFCQGEEFEMAIRTFVAPLVAATIEWRGLEAVAQFVPFHPPRLWRPKGATRNVTEHPSMLINTRSSTLFKMEFNRFRASEKEVNTLQNSFQFVYTKPHRYLDLGYISY